MTKYLLCIQLFLMVAYSLALYQNSNELYDIRGDSSAPAENNGIMELPKILDVLLKMLDKQEEETNQDVIPSKRGGEIKRIHPQTRWGKRASLPQIRWG